MRTSYKKGLSDFGNGCYGYLQPDGSWAGNHCITGRTFCTATALLVLMGDRAPRPDAVVEPTVSAPVV